MKHKRNILIIIIDIFLGVALIYEFGSLGISLFVKMNFTIAFIAIIMMYKRLGIFSYLKYTIGQYLSNVYGVRLYYMKDLFTHSMLVVPNKQMEDFIFIMDLNPDGVSFDSEPFAIGNKVKVIKGDFSGIEGEIATQANKTYVVIRIKDVLVASIKVPKSYLKLIN